MLEKAIVVSPSLTEYSVLAFRLFVALGDEKEATNRAKQLVKTESDDPYALLSMVICSLMAGNIRDAQSHLSFVKEAHAKIKKSPEGQRRKKRREEELFHFLDAVCARYSSNGSFDSFLAASKTAIEEQFATVQGVAYGIDGIFTLDVDFLVGIVYQIMDFAPISVSESKEKKGLPDVNYLLARVKLLLGQTEIAERLVEELARGTDATAEVFLLKAQIKIDKGRMDEALESALDTGLSQSFAVRDLIKVKVQKGQQPEYGLRLDQPKIYQMPLSTASIAMDSTKTRKWFNSDSRTRSGKRFRLMEPNMAPKQQAYRFTKKMQQDLFTTLPDDCLLSVFSYVDRETLDVLERVSQKMNFIINHKGFHKLKKVVDSFEIIEHFGRLTLGAENVSGKNQEKRLVYYGNGLKSKASPYVNGEHGNNRVPDDFFHVMRKLFNKYAPEKLEFDKNSFNENFVREFSLVDAQELQLDVCKIPRAMSRPWTPQVDFLPIICRYKVLRSNTLSLTTDLLKRLIHMAFGQTSGRIEWAFVMESIPQDSEIASLGTVTPGYYYDAKYIKIRKHKRL
ncbi:hypothetical protein PRIPAC_93996, partial [Pristionchus pacificus]|uniref:F-box domain-containing protein n=1 Tax=Pristionchus pacificus TaxID=54126 RepID=A0A2A6BII8_PRIPA